MSQPGDETNVPLLLGPVFTWTMKATELAHSGRAEDRAAAAVYAQAALAQATAALAAAQHNQQQP